MKIRIIPSTNEVFLTFTANAHLGSPLPEPEIDILQLYQAFGLKLPELTPNLSLVPLQSGRKLAYLFISQEIKTTKLKFQEVLPGDYEANSVSFLQQFETTTEFKFSLSELQEVLKKYELFNQANSQLGICFWENF